MRASALVVEADPPVSNASRWGNAGKGTVTILVEGGPDGPIYASRGFRLNENRWLVAGMEIPISIDPAEPEGFEVEWDAIPSIEERVAANDPTLSDPVESRRRVSSALESAGVQGLPAGPRRGGMAGGPGGPGPNPDRLEEAIRGAAQKPAPPGKQRAVVVVAAIVAAGDSDDGIFVEPNSDGPL